MRKSDNTLRAYRAGWKDFQRWCAHNDMQALPASPEALKNYILDRNNELALSTLNGRIAAIRHYHEKAGLQTPTDSDIFREFWRNLCSEGGQLLAAFIEDEPIKLDQRKRMLIPEEKDDLLTIRDRAIILLGIWGDLQRSEIVSVNREHVELMPHAANVRIMNPTHSTPPSNVFLEEQDNQHICPVRALRAWIETSQIQDGPLFRNVNRHRQISLKRLADYSVTLIVRRAAKNAGLDPSEFSAEDLRQRPAK